MTEQRDLNREQQAKGDRDDPEVNPTIDAEVVADLDASDGEAGAVIGERMDSCGPGMSCKPG